MAGRFLRGGAALQLLSLPRSHDSGPDEAGLDRKRRPGKDPEQEQGYQETVELAGQGCQERLSRIRRRRLLFGQLGRRVAAGEQDPNPRKPQARDRHRSRHRHGHLGRSRPGQRRALGANGGDVDQRPGRIRDHREHRRLRLRSRARARGPLPLRAPAQNFSRHHQVQKARYRVRGFPLRTQLLGDRHGGKSGRRHRVRGGQVLYQERYLRHPYRLAKRDPLLRAIIATGRRDLRDPAGRGQPGIDSATRRDRQPQPDSDLFAAGRKRGPAGLPVQYFPARLQARRYFPVRDHRANTQWRQAPAAQTAVRGNPQYCD